MKAIVFGSKGQDGFYLSKLLSDSGIDVIPVGRADKNSLIHISDFSHVSILIQKNLPDYIFHLAANSTTRHDAMFENHNTICTGTLNILEAVRAFSPDTKVFISGSGLQFSNIGEPIKETNEFEARDPYSVSRIHSVYAARYFRSLGIQVYVGYFFNHDSPRRSERHMAKRISEAVKRIAAGSDEKIQIGNIEVIKEWTFAGDVVKAIWVLVQQNNIFEANIGSGLGFSIKDWLEVCFKLIGKDWRDYVLITDGFKVDYQSMISDPSLIFSLGWAPETSIEELAIMMIEN